MPARVAKKACNGEILDELARSSMADGCSQSASDWPDPLFSAKRRNLLPQSFLERGPRLALKPRGMVRRCPTDRHTVFDHYNSQQTYSIS